MEEQQRDMTAPENDYPDNHADRRAGDGKPRWCELSVKFLRDRRDRIVGVTGVTRDVSQRRQFERRLSEVIVRQHQEIGQQLHDGLGQQLLGARLTAEDLRRKLQARGAQEAEIAGQIVRVLTEAQQSVAEIIKGARPVEVEAGGLTAALAGLAESTEKVAGISCVFDCDEPVVVADSHTATQLFYIGQEAIRNAVTHAGATQIVARLSSEDSKITLSVCDDGSGIPGKMAADSGMGIPIMRHRASVIGATVTISRAEGGGTLVACVLPLEQP